MQQTSIRSRSKSGSKAKRNSNKGYFTSNSTQSNNNTKSSASSGAYPKFRKQTATNKGKKVSKLDPNLLVKKGYTVEVKAYRSNRLIKDMPIHGALKQRLLKKGYERPTEIQDRTLEALLQRRNLLGIAQTGTGKTAAFLIPIIEQLLHRKQKPYALVVVPTRELALQVADEFRSMTGGLGLYSACFIGGTSINRDLQQLRRSSHLIIATPGRLIDLMKRNAINLAEFNTLVLDEFDRMLDMGFVKDVEYIVSRMQNRQQTMLFSATYDKEQRQLIEKFLPQKVTVKVSNGESSNDHIDQDIVRINNGEDKFDVLLDMVSDEDFQKVLIFEETKHKASRLCKKLNRAGITSEEIHGNKSQGARQRALSMFKEGRIQVLVATDVAARGIDVMDITHVINYQVPMTFDSYIHRIGRTGRAGKMGKAFTFVE